jgi:hypothetical protein
MLAMIMRRRSSLCFKASTARFLLCNIGGHYQSGGLAVEVQGIRTNLHIDNLAGLLAVPPGAGVFSRSIFFLNGVQERRHIFPRTNVGDLKAQEFFVGVPVGLERRGIHRDNHQSFHIKDPRGDGIAVE